MAELSTYGRERLMRTAWTAVIRDDRAPHIREVRGAAPWFVVIVVMDVASTERPFGTMPMKKPSVTTVPAANTEVFGEALFSKDDTRIVRGNTSPRAIYVGSRE